MWLRKLIPYPHSKAASTTDEVRSRVKSEHAKVTKELDASFDHLIGLLDDALQSVNNGKLRQTHTDTK